MLFCHGDIVIFLFAFLYKCGKVNKVQIIAGLFEFDDMIHNGFGCMLGSMLAGLLLQRLIDSNLQIE